MFFFGGGGGLLANTIAYCIHVCEMWQVWLINESGLISLLIYTVFWQWQVVYCIHVCVDNACKWNVTGLYISIPLTFLIDRDLYQPLFYVISLLINSTDFNWNLMNFNEGVIFLVYWLIGWLRPLAVLFFINEDLMNFILPRKVIERVSIFDKGQNIESGPSWKVLGLF